MKNKKTKIIIKKRKKKEKGYAYRVGSKWIQTRRAVHISELRVRVGSTWTRPDAAKERVAVRSGDRTATHSLP
jgi:hypothetical protein